MSDDFYNPFANLNPLQYPAREIKNLQSSSTPEEKKDRELFLQVVNNIPLHSPKKRKGYTIKDLGILPISTPVKKKRKPSPQKPDTIPALPTDEEENPFLAAMDHVTPLKGQGRRIAPKPKGKKPVIPPEISLEDFMAGKLEFAISTIGEYLEGHVAGFDELILNRLRSGQFSPEAHIDLHGLNSEQAFETLREFMRQAWLKDLRVVLIVTGRGRNSPQGYGILRQMLQSWLTKEPFKRIVLAFCTATPHDGGPGAIYVLLRRFRKKGRIQWDRIFIDGNE